MTLDQYVLVQKALDRVHGHCRHNKAELSLSTAAHCFHCKGSFLASDVREWITRGKPGEERHEETALCPKCGIDSVIGDASGYEMTSALLHAMHEFWFERRVLPEDFDFNWFQPV